jgi:hypothetical protein
VRKVSAYIRTHTRFLVDYGARYRKGLPISSGIAESAVNQVVSVRMEKKQQMRWSDEARRRGHSRSPASKVRPALQIEFKLIASSFRRPS